MSKLPRDIENAPNQDDLSGTYFHGDNSVLDLPEKWLISDLAEAVSSWMFAGTWQAGEYQRGKVVKAGNYLRKANKTTSEDPTLSPVGAEISTYTPVSQVATTAEDINQVVFGVRHYGVSEPLFIEEIGFNVTAGNTYAVYIVKDPLGVAEFDFIGQFATSSAAARESLETFKSSLVPRLLEPNTVFDVRVVESQESTPDTQTIAAYNVETISGSNVTYTSGTLLYARDLADQLHIANQDADGNNIRAVLTALKVGDLIDVGDDPYSIQSTDIQTDGVSLTISPPVAPSSSGSTIVTITQKLAVDITYNVDAGYYTENTDTKCLLVVGGGLSEVVETNDNVGGIYVKAQRVNDSDDWDTIL